MAFGQSPGPAASHRQMAELLELLQAEGFDGYRDARGPMGFNQRQGNGKFTGEEADAYIAQLYEQAESADDQSEAPVARKAPQPKSQPVQKQQPKASPVPRAVLEAGDEVLVAELERRGWVVTAPPR